MKCWPACSDLANKWLSLRPDLRESRKRYREIESINTTTLFGYFAEIYLSNPALHMSLSCDTNNASSEQSFEKESLEHTVREYFFLGIMGAQDEWQYCSVASVVANKAGPLSV